MDRSGPATEAAAARCSCTLTGPCTMGCGDACPYVPTTVENWDIPDPAGSPAGRRRAIRDGIEPRSATSSSTALDAIYADRDRAPAAPPQTAPRRWPRSSRAVAPTRTSGPAPTPSSALRRRARPLLHHDLDHSPARECLAPTCGAPWRHLTDHVLDTCSRSCCRCPRRCDASRSSPTSTPTCRRCRRRWRASTSWASTRVYCGGDLVGYGPHPNEVCALIAERDIPTIYGNYDYAIARDLDDCGCAYITPHDRELGQLSVEWTLVHTDQTSKDFMRELPFDLRFDVGDDAGAPRARLAAQGQRVPLRGQAGRSLYERLAAGRGRRRARVRPHPQALGRTSTVACCSSTAARSASPRTATPAAPSPSCGQAGAAVDVTIERVAYDAAAVAREVAAAGLPGEFADKLLLAA